MNYAEQKKLTAAANKLLRAATKKTPQKKSKANLLFKVFAQTSGHFPPGVTPFVCKINTQRDFDNKHHQLGKLEFLPNKTYYKANLTKEGIYFFKNLEIVMKKDFYFGPGISGFFYLKPDGKIDILNEEEARQNIANQSTSSKLLD